MLEVINGQQLKHVRAAVIFGVMVTVIANIAETKNRRQELYWGKIANSTTVQTDITKQTIYGLMENAKVVPIMAAANAQVQPIVQAVFMIIISHQTNGA